MALVTLWCGVDRWAARLPKSPESFIAGQIGQCLRWVEVIGELSFEVLLGLAAQQKAGIGRFASDLPRSTDNCPSKLIRITLPANVATSPAQFDFTPYLRPQYPNNASTRFCASSGARLWGMSSLILAISFSCYGSLVGNDEPSGATRARSCLMNSPPTRCIRWKPGCSPPPRAVRRVQRNHSVDDLQIELVAQPHPVERHPIAERKG